MTTVQINITVDLGEAAERYIHSCARIRNISINRLMTRMATAICNDQLVLAVLDDESKQLTDLPDEKRYYSYQKK